LSTFGTYRTIIVFSRQLVGNSFSELPITFAIKSDLKIAKFNPLPISKLA